MLVLGFQILLTAALLLSQLLEQTECLFESSHLIRHTFLTSPITASKAMQPTCTRSPTAAAILAVIMAGAGAASPPTKPTNRPGPEKLRCCSSCCSEFFRHSLTLEYRRGRMKDSLCFLDLGSRITFHHFN